MIKVKNIAADAAELYISGDIIDDDEGSYYKSWGIDDGYEFPKKVQEQLATLKGKDLTVYINSSGGSVPAGVAIANMIARHDGHTKAVVDGWCCSIATQIFFAAKEREIPTNAYLMIHKPSTTVGGDADDMRKAAEVLDILQDGLETTYLKAAKDGITKDMIHDMVNAETWLTGSEAANYFELQVADKNAAAAKVGAGVKNFAHIPKALQEMVQPSAAVNEAAAEIENKNKQCVAIALAVAKGAMTE